MGRDRQRILWVRVRARYPRRDRFLGRVPERDALHFEALCGVAVLVAACLVLIPLDFMGSLCGFMAIGLFFVPALLGGGLGIILRTRWLWSLSPRDIAAVALLVAVALPIEAALTPAQPPEQIVTSQVIDADRAAAWGASCSMGTSPRGRRYSLDSDSPAPWNPGRTRPGGCRDRMPL